MPSKLKIGISACLTGEKVRYDGESKLDRQLLDSLSGVAELVPICPEVDCGLTIPRPKMELRGETESPRIVVIETSRDLTDKFTSWSAGKINELEKLDLDGFIFKSRSPSCGISVPVWDESGSVIGSAPGIFAGLFIKSFDDAITADEEKLNGGDRLRQFLESCSDIATCR
ncbi:hypothetical protein CEE37_07350 [candidate division LCP-89 bacterium B3_LCP]|uniref:Uncharacterized protein n=1 Tax=candidate division LCP-89 bacterium B3_LCP TaxID=2012998 RepID=A0A532V0N5_UNCL8|nr:MAG: hypothetical protein CEE37_07350 [candidate division LCP-89 bacterium B3_LCP]